MSESKLLKEMGERIYARRKFLKLTQDELAEKTGVSTQMISNLELGKKAIRPENLVKICSVLSISSDYILTGSTPALPDNPAPPDNNILRKLQKLSTQELSLIESFADYIIEVKKY